VGGCVSLGGGGDEGVGCYYLGWGGGRKGRGREDVGQADGVVAYRGEEEGC
jgi:hypothetical protein